MFSYKILQSASGKFVGDKSVRTQWSTVCRRILGEPLSDGYIDTSRVDAVVQALLGGR